MILSVSKTGEKRFHELELLFFTRNCMDTSYEFIRILYILSLLNKLMFEEKVKVEKAKAWLMEPHMLLIGNLLHLRLHEKRGNINFQGFLD